MTIKYWDLILDDIEEIDGCVSGEDVIEDFDLPIHDILDNNGACEEWNYDFSGDLLDDSSIVQGLNFSCDDSSQPSHRLSSPKSYPTSPLSELDSISSYSDVILRTHIPKRRRSNRSRVSAFSMPTLFRPYFLIRSESDSESCLTEKIVKRHKKKKNQILLSGSIEMDESRSKQYVVVRRCTHCEVTKTPQWREGPKGPNTLCNACGVRYRSGRLLPEYRPAASPTFVPSLHSNSHKKVVEMRIEKAKLPTTGTPSVLSIRKKRHCAKLPYMYIGEISRNLDDEAEVETIHVQLGGPD